jgi:hypothetical protein
MMGNMTPSICTVNIYRATRSWASSGLLAIIALAIVMAPVIAWAASNSDDEVKPDGRLEGYGPIVIPDSGSALTYLLLVFLILITAGVTFMNSKRSHLD